MAFFAWDDKYLTGITEIDMQHKRLVTLVCDLYDAMQAGKGSEIIGKVLNELISYTKTHFATEERLMQAKKYGDYSAHKTEHDAFTRKVLELQQDFKAGKVTISIEVGKFLREWLTTHILGTDKKYVAALKG